MEVIEIDHEPQDQMQNSAREFSPEIEVTFSKTSPKTPESGQENSSTLSTPTKPGNGNPPVTPKSVQSAPRPRLTTAQKEARNKELEEKRLKRAEELRIREEKKEEEKRSKEEKRKRLEEEKQAKEAEKKRDKEAKEADRLKKLEEKNRKEQEANQKKAEKEAEAAKREEAKNEERKRKEEKEEEKRKKEEAKRLEEEKKEKAVKRQQDLMRSFVVVKPPPVAKFLPGSVGFETFKPYQIQDGIRLANLQRVEPLSAASLAMLDSVIHGESEPRFSDTQHLYIKELKSGRHIPKKTGPTCPKETDVELIVSRPKYKLIHFSDNARPAYYGTFSRPSTTVRPRNPFAQDTAIFDYDVDSDDEWENDQNAESVADSEDEQSSEEEPDDDEGDDFIVNDELDPEENDEDEITPEAAFEMKEAQSVVDSWMKKKNQVQVKLKKRVVGPFWADQENVCPLLLKSLAALQLYDPEEEDAGITTISHEELGENVNKIPVSFMPYLIKLVHGSTGKKTAAASAVSELLQNRSDPDFVSLFPAFDDKLPGILESLEVGKWTSKDNLVKAILAIAEWKKPPSFGQAQVLKTCWFVKEDVRALYKVLEGESSLPNPNCLVKRPADTSTNAEPAKKKPRLTDDLPSTPKSSKPATETTPGGRKWTPKLKSGATSSASKQQSLLSFIKKDANSSMMDEKNISTATDSSVNDMEVQTIDLTSDPEGSN